MSQQLRHVLHSTIFWMMLFTVLLFTGCAYARPALRVIGLILGALGGQGIEGTNL